MNESTQAAQAMLNAEVKTAEIGARGLAAAGKNLAAVTAALLRKYEKLSGKTGLKKLLRQGKEMAVFQIREGDIGRFREMSKQYGVMFTAIRNTERDTGMAELLCRAEDARQVNRMMERLGYPAPAREEDGEKKETARARSEKGSERRGPGSAASARTAMTNEPEKAGRPGRESRPAARAAPGPQEPERKPSVRARIEAIKAAQSGMGEPAPAIAKGSRTPASR